MIQIKCSLSFCNPLIVAFTWNGLRIIQCCLCPLLQKQIFVQKPLNWISSHVIMFNSSSVILWSHSSSNQEFFLISFVFVYHCDYIYRKIIIVLKGRVEINSVGDPVWAPRIRKENVNTVATTLNSKYYMKAKSSWFE